MDKIINPIIKIQYPTKDLLNNILNLTDMSNEILNSAKRSFAKKHSEYGLVTCVDERAYTCGYAEGVLYTNEIYAEMIAMLQEKVRVLEKETDYPTLNLQNRQS